MTPNASAVLAGGHILRPEAGAASSNGCSIPGLLMTSPKNSFPALHSRLPPWFLAPLSPETLSPKKEAIPASAPRSRVRRREGLFVFMTPPGLVSCAESEVESSIGGKGRIVGGEEEVPLDVTAAAMGCKYLDCLRCACQHDGHTPPSDAKTMPIAPQEPHCEPPWP